VCGGTGSKGKARVREDRGKYGKYSLNILSLFLVFLHTDLYLDKILPQEFLICISKE
jgi:hypothetical protein